MFAVLSEEELCAKANELAQRFTTPHCLDLIRCAHRGFRAASTIADFSRLASRVATHFGESCLVEEVVELTCYAASLFGWVDAVFATTLALSDGPREQMEAFARGSLMRLPNNIMTDARQRKLESNFIRVLEMASDEAVAQGDTASDISRHLVSLLGPVMQLTFELRGVHEMLELVHDHFHLSLFVVTFAELSIKSSAFNDGDFAVLLDVQFERLVRSACETENCNAFETANVSRFVHDDF